MTKEKAKKKIDYQTKKEKKSYDNLSVVIPYDSNIQPSFKYYYMKSVLLLPAWVIRELEHVEGNAANGRLGQRVEARHVRAPVVDALQHSRQLGVVVVDKFNGRRGRMARAKRNSYKQTGHNSC